jgi:UDP-N-acetylmuramoyl-tripeptide--D-alanyl-D-alanine ligase
MAKANIFSFGLNPKADVRATEIIDGEETIQFSLSFQEKTKKITLPMPGRHNVMNALAAAAACLKAGIDLEVIKKGLESASPEKGRLNKYCLSNGAIVIDDCYNANPASFKAAIDVLSQYQQRHKILVMGDMKELGLDEKAMHQDIGIYAKKAGIDELFTFGELAESASAAFGDKAQHFSSKEDLMNALKIKLNDQAVALVKASRSMHFEDIINHAIPK